MTQSAVTNRGISAGNSAATIESLNVGACLGYLSEDFANMVRFSEDYQESLNGMAPGKFLSAEVCEYMSGAGVETLNPLFEEHSFG